MPILEFYCDKCNKKFDDLVKIGTTEHACPTCGEPCERAYTGECNMVIPGQSTGLKRTGAGAPGRGLGK